MQKPTQFHAIIQALFCDIGMHWCSVQYITCTW